MPNEHTTLTALFVDIADSIREKTGGTELIVADCFPEETDAIPTGIIPTGSLTVVENGTHDVAQYAEAIVNVSGAFPVGLEYLKSAAINQNLSFTEIEEITVDLSGYSNLSSLNGFYRTTPKPVKTISIVLPNGFQGGWDYAFYGDSSNMSSDSLETIAVNADIKPTSTVGIFNNRPNLKRIIGGKVDFSAVSTSTGFSATNYNNPFRASTGLETISFARNCIDANWVFNWSAVLTSTTLVSIANALVAGGHTLTLHSTPKGKLISIMGAVTDGVFSADESGTVTLENFITQTKGWTVA